MSADESWDTDDAPRSCHRCGVHDAPSLHQCADLAPVLALSSRSPAEERAVDAVLALDVRIEVLVQDVTREEVREIVRAALSGAVNAVDLSWAAGVHLPPGTPDVGPTAHAIAASVRGALGVDR